MTAGFQIQVYVNLRKLVQHFAYASLQPPHIELWIMLAYLFQSVLMALIGRFINRSLCYTTLILKD